QYRACDWKNCVASLQKSMELSDGGDCKDWFLLAMAYWKLDDKQQARKWFDQAVNGKDKSLWHEDLDPLHKEAEELLGSKQKPEPTTQKPEARKEDSKGSKQ